MRKQKLYDNLVTCKEALPHPTRPTEKIFVLNRNYNFEYRKIGSQWWYVILDYKRCYSMKNRTELGSYTCVGPYFEINVFLTSEEFERYFYRYNPNREKIKVKRPYRVKSVLKN